MNAAPLLTSATYVALLVSIVGLWFGRRVWIPALLVAIGFGYWAGVLFGPAIVWMLLLAGACIAFDRARGGLGERGSDTERPAQGAGAAGSARALEAGESARRVGATEFAGRREGDASAGRGHAAESARHDDAAGSPRHSDATGFARRGRSPGSAVVRRGLKALAAAAIIVLALLLGMHALPGFRNFLAFEKVVLSPGAEPYTLYLNFDKTVVGILIVGLCGQRLLTHSRGWSRAIARAAPIAAITIVLVALGALALGYFTWQPKWTPLFWLWAANNLFFVCLSEEAFFRAFIQRELQSALSGTRAAAALSITASAVLFGVAHFAGGPQYILLATAAGLGYALVYHRTQSIELSMLTHFTLNAAHFLLFTYPRAV